ncbi:MAG: helix-turn-helix domain-containing protein [Candidatus Limnocylindria bacterium]
MAAHARDPGDYPSLSPDDVAQLLGLHAETVRRMARRGQLRAYRVAGRLKFCLNDVDQLAFADPMLPTHREPAPPRHRRTSTRSGSTGSVSRLDEIERDAGEGMR